MTSTTPAPAVGTRIGHGIYLTPSDAAMTRDELATWLRARGVHGAAELDANLTQYAGKTEAEMDAVYDAMHGE